MKVKARILVNGRPLRRAYVEHIVLGVGTEMYMTHTDGTIRDADFNEGIDSITPNADIRIICQNPVLRVLDGNRANVGVYQDVSINDGDTVNLNTRAEQRDHYNILNRAHIGYEVAFRPLSFFRNLPNPNFPLGRKSSLRETRDLAERVDLSFPDQFVGPTLSFVEPMRLIDKFPLIHLKTGDARLFGTGREAPTLIPSELAHALHFSFLSEEKRGRAEAKYLEFILASPISGVGPFHDFDRRTTAEVAYIEALDWFSQLFMEFIRARQRGTSTLVNPVQITPAIQAEFVASEWSRLTEATEFSRRRRVTLPANPRTVAVNSRMLPAIAAIPGGGRVRLRPPSPTLPTRRQRALRRPMITGGDVEGAVYGAIFVDFASTVGLDFAASTYFAANALTFGEYRGFINKHHPEHSETLEQVRRFWGL